ncbi:(d)CMP kinase [Gemelliphila asaccharolytica]|uniref:Cytidylate kinase n=1 Tax=Gemelliphila asaccharolytica TaxID=502393 RepID=A0ABR5TMH6_9BACL|nr:cytidylate kinase [Gemella asaccharolytica]
MSFSVAIDGPAGSGKSTITKKVAEDLKFNYVDTGALYRSLTYNFLQNNLKKLEEEKIKNILEKTKIKVLFDGSIQRQLINGEDVTEKIRTKEISKYASLFAKSKNVRDYLITIQRNLAKKENVIMDGRDIGSVVLPNADVKIFLTASVDERAKRRFNELKEKSLSLEEIKEEIKKRDFQDKNRQIAPLKKTDDAIEIDSTFLTIKEVVDKIKNIILKAKEVK